MRLYYAIHKSCVSPNSDKSWSNPTCETCTEKLTITLIQFIKKKIQLLFTHQEKQSHVKWKEMGVSLYRNMSMV